MKTWVDKHGKKRFQGNGRLKSSETLVFKTEANHTHVYIYIYVFHKAYVSAAKVISQEIWYEICQISAGLAKRIGASSTHQQG